MDSHEQTRSPDIRSQSRKKGAGQNTKKLHTGAPLRALNQSQFLKAVKAGKENDMNIKHMLQELGLSEKDINDIEEVCKRKDITVRDLLHQFLCDLIDNEYSGGSDEQINLMQWFYRSQF